MYFPNTEHNVFFLLSRYCRSKLNPGFQMFTLWCTAFCVGTCVLTFFVTFPFNAFNFQAL